MTLDSPKTPTIPNHARKNRSLCRVPEYIPINIGIMEHILDTFHLCKECEEISGNGSQ